MTLKPIWIVVGMTGIAIAGAIAVLKFPPSTTNSTPTVAASTPPQVSPVSKASASSASSPASEASVSRSESTQQPTAREPRPVAVSRKVEQCRITMVRVSDPNPPLNVRSSPNAADASNIVGKLDNGRYVEVAEERNGWFLISANDDTPFQGWIAKSRTESNCNTKVERVEFGTGATSVTLRDRFIGAGSHRYRLRLTKGQQLSISDATGLPSIQAPDGTWLQEPPLANGDSWTSAVSMTGDYTLIKDSNYKGYTYALTVSVR